MLQPMEQPSPERIRELRGTTSRAAFARRLGVTPHTVYRWELPEDANESRRPRGTELQKLLALARGEAPDASEPPALRRAFAAPERAPAAEDIALVLPALQRAFSSEPQRGHGELVQLTMRRPSLSPDALALARFGVAVLELLQRSDPRAALLVLAPALQQADAGELAEEVQGRAAACTRCWPPRRRRSATRWPTSAAWRRWSPTRPRRSCASACAGKTCTGTTEREGGAAQRQCERSAA
jgi:transcriptional regulator with XRE-family HTH domain